MLRRLVGMALLVLGPPAALAGPHVVFVSGDGGATGMRLASMHFATRCRAERVDAACETEIRYTLIAGPRRETVLGAFYTFAQPSPPTVTLDGKVPPAVSDRADLTRLDGAEGGGQSLTDVLEAGTLGRAAFVMAAEPGSRHELVWRGRLWAIGEEAGSSSSPRFSPLRVRHLVFAGRSTQSYHLVVPSETPGLLRDEQTRVDGEVTAPSFSGVTREGTRITLKTLPIRNGGPVLAVGGAHVDGAWSLRGRLGYELAVVEILFPSVSLEIGTNEDVLIVPMLKVASASTYLILPPSLGAALGVPIQLGGPTRVGIRLYADVHPGPAGLAVSVDLFPAQGDAPFQAALTLMGQVSL